MESNPTTRFQRCEKCSHFVFRDDDVFHCVNCGYDLVDWVECSIEQDHPKLDTDNDHSFQLKDYIIA